MPLRKPEEKGGPLSENQPSKFTVMAPDVFISHCSADMEIAKRITNLLITTLGMTDKDIRCSSVPGFKFSGGDVLHHEIKKEAIKAKVFLGLLTKASLDSRYVQFELGARWGSENKLTPILGPGYTREILTDGPLSDLLPVMCDSESMVQLLENIREVTGHSLKSMSFVSSQVDEFINFCNALPETSIENAKTSEEKLPEGSEYNEQTTATSSDSHNYLTDVEIKYLSIAIEYGPIRLAEIYHEGLLVGGDVDKLCDTLTHREVIKLKHVVNKMVEKNLIEILAPETAIKINGKSPSLYFQATYEGIESIESLEEF